MQFTLEQTFHFTAKKHTKLTPNVHPNCLELNKLGLFSISFSCRNFKVKNLGGVVQFYCQVPMPQRPSTRNIKWGVFSVAKHLGSKRQESSIDFTTKYPILLHFSCNQCTTELSFPPQSQKRHFFRLLIESEHNPCCTFQFYFKRFNHNTGDYCKLVFDIYTSVEPVFSTYTHMYLLFVVNRELLSEAKRQS